VRSLGKHEHRWENNVKMDVVEHSVNVRTAFNLLRNNPITNFMNNVTHNKWEFADQLNNCKLFKEDLVPRKIVNQIH
jgi:hypothetical protein